MLWCAGKIANRLVSDDMFSEKVAANIERNIPQRLQNEGGITASAATQFHRGNFIVVLVSIEQIDLRKMLQSKLDEKKMKRFDQIMHYLEFFPSWVKVDLQNLILQEAGLLHSSKVLRVFSLDQSFACIHWPYIYIYINIYHRTALLNQERPERQKLQKAWFESWFLDTLFSQWQDGLHHTCTSLVWVKDHVWSSIYPV